MTLFIRKNLPLKIFCLLLSISLWGLVKYTQSPWILKNSYQTTLNIPVEYHNKPRELSLVNQVTYVAVSVKGSSGIIDSLTPSRFSASIDLKDFKEGSSWADVDFQSPPGITVTEIRPSRINVSLEAKVSRILPVELVFEGEPGRGYEIANYTYSPKEAEVRGLKTLVDSVSKLSAKINVAGLVASSREILPLVPVSKNNKPLDISVLPSKIDVSLKIASDNNYRSLSVVPVFRGMPAKDYQIVNSVWSPQSVLVKIRKNAELKSGIIKTMPVDINKLSSNKEFDVALDEQATFSVVGSNFIHVKVFVKKEVSK